MRQNTMRDLRGEAEATIMELQVRDELLESDYAADIGISRATGENPSTDPDATYYDYYAETYEQHWDQHHP